MCSIALLLEGNNVHDKGSPLCLDSSNVSVIVFRLCCVLKPGMLYANGSSLWFVFMAGTPMSMLQFTAFLPSKTPPRR